MEVFEMIFNDNGNITTIELEHEPVGYDAIDFNLNQEEDRYGRDWSFVGDGMVKLELRKHSNYDAFVKFEEIYQKYGFESDIKFKITDGNETYIGSVASLLIEYNGHDIFYFDLHQETEEALVKKRADLVVNLFGAEDLDGNFSQPIFPKNMLLPAKQIFRESVWENKNGDQTIFYSTSGGTAQNVRFNYTTTTTKYEIKNSLSMMPYSGLDGWQQSNANFKFISAATDLNSLIMDIDYNGSSVTEYPGSGSITLSLIMRIGNPPTNQTQWLAGQFIVLDSYNVNNQTVNLINKTITLPGIQTGKVIHIYFQIQGNGGGEFSYKSVKYTLKAYEQNFDVISPCVSVYDAAKKIIHDISGLEVVFPLAQTGVLKNNYIFSGNMVRAIQKPFNVSFDDLKKWFPELNLDYEIMSDRKVYIGKREDYYTDNEIEVFDNVAFDSYMETQNERYAINQFTYKYGKYQSQKENTEENTNDIVHGEAEYHVNNLQVENLSSVEVSFVRDPFMLQETINAALTETDSKATQDDDTIFIIDGANMTTADYNKAKTSVLLHQIKEGNRLALSNDGSFRWDLLGFRLGSVFQILTNENKGVYNVIDITSTVIGLNRFGLMPIPTFSGEVFTSFKYVIDKDEVKLKPYFFNSLIIGGGSVVENIKSPETYANLRFSVGLNIRNYYTDFISTTIKNNKPVKQIKYINNDKYENNAYAPKHYENADISTITPILSTKIVETKLIMDFVTYMRICRVLRSTSRGFFRTFNPKGEPICIYPQFMKAIYKTSGLKEVTVKGELKNVQEQINITKTNGLYNIWIYKYQIFEIKIENDYLIFRDPNGIAFYQKSHYSDIKVNGNNYNSAMAVMNAINAL